MKIIENITPCEMGPCLIQTGTESSVWEAAMKHQWLKDLPL